MPDSSSPTERDNTGRPNMGRHAIRLRGPWWWSAGTRFDQPQATRVAWGAELKAAPLDALVMRRSFNSPTGLAAADRVHLVAEGVEHLQGIELNGQAVWSRDAATTGSAVIDVDIRQTLQAANQLDLRFALPRPAPSRISGEVRLEIAPCT